MDWSTLDEVLRLAAPAARVVSGRALAGSLGAEDLLMFVRDPALGVLVPAPGFARTLRGGPSWRAFLDACTAQGIRRDEVEMPPGSWRPAVAIIEDGLTAVLLGGHVAEDALAVLRKCMPLLAVAMNAEQRAALAEAQAAESDKAARRTQALIDALESARAEAWRLNAQLTEEHRRRDDFLAMLAHELRNPLAPLVTALAVLRRGGAAMVASQVEVMDRQLRQLSRMVDDLLDVSRVKHGKIELRKERVAVADVLKGAIEATRPMLDARSHIFHLALPAQPIFVDADPVRLTQVFSNLLHNAAKYTDPGGSVRVVVTQDVDSVVVRVSDTGLGIAAEILPQVFELFVQAPVSLDRAQGGLGIGLTLVRSLVELHGGNVHASSPGVGQGSAFEVRLLCTADAAVAHDQRTAHAEAQPGRRVLVVDDNVDLTGSLALLLKLMGHKVDTAHSGLEALQIARDVDPDVVLLDIGLPGIDGYEVGRRLRRIIRGDAVLVAMTGYGSPEDRRRSGDAGFDQHLVKPLSMDDLTAILAGLPRGGERVASGAALH